MKLTFYVPDEISAELKTAIEKIVADITKWPQYGDKFYYVDAYGLVNSQLWVDDYENKNLQQFGNFFKTEEEAEFKAEQLKVLHELEELSDDDQPWDLEKIHYGIFYDHERRAVAVVTYVAFQHGSYYFKTIESAYNALAQIGEDRLKKYYFKVED